MSYDAILIRLGINIDRQVVGISFGSFCVPLVAGMFCLSLYERRFGRGWPTARNLFQCQRVLIYCIFIA